MKLVEMNCPSCGADLKLDADNVRAVCEYCGAEVLIDGGARRDPEQEGYEFEKGRQRAIAEAQASASHKRITWLWVIGWIFMFPAPVTILVSRSKLKTWQKAAIIALAWAAYLSIGLFGGKKKPGGAAATGTVSSSSVEASDASLPDQT